MQRMLASFHLRAPRAVSASVHSAALAPGTLLAAMLTPVPVQQNRMPWSQAPSATRSATFIATSGHGSGSSAGGPEVLGGQR